jgi:hypothetical protein
MGIDADDRPHTPLHRSDDPLGAAGTSGSRPRSTLLSSHAAARETGRGRHFKSQRRGASHGSRARPHPLVSGRRHLHYTPGHGSVHLIVVNERHLQAILTEFVHFYNYERPHRTLTLETPEPLARSTTGSIRARPVLGGLHHAYERAA